MGKLSELPNIGKDTERQLNEVNITTADELRAVGAEQAWLRIQKIDSSACINRLMGLEGAVCGVKKTFLPEDRKAELREFYNLHKIPRR